MNIYYVKQVDDGDWTDNSAKDNRFFAFRTHAQQFADVLNAAEKHKEDAYREESYARWSAKEALIQRIRAEINIDVTPLIPGHNHEFEYHGGFWSDQYEVVEAEVE